MSNRTKQESLRNIKKQKSYSSVKWAQFWQYVVASSRHKNFLQASHTYFVLWSRLREQKSHLHCLLGLYLFARGSSAFPTIILRSAILSSRGTLKLVILALRYSLKNSLLVVCENLFFFNYAVIIFTMNDLRVDGSSIHQLEGEALVGYCETRCMFGWQFVLVSLYVK